MFKFISYGSLCEDAEKIREKVFVSEQGFEREFDDVDGRAVHIVMYDGEAPMGVCRYYDENGEYTLGRIAVLPEYRGKSCGSLLVREAERRMRLEGAKSVSLAAQVRAKGFYESLGYEPCGEEFYDEYCPHVKMKKIFTESLPQEE